MTIEQFKKMLNKRRWTARELGIIYVTHSADMYRASTDKESLFQINWQKYFSCKELLDERGMDIFKGYELLRTWIIVYYNICQSYGKQFEAMYYLLLDMHLQAATGEKATAQYNALPLILSAGQYKKQPVKKNKRAEKNGIAVMLANYTNYTMPDIKGTLKDMCIDSPLDDAEEYKKIKDYYKTLTESLYFLYGFNALLDILCECYGIPDTGLDVFKADLPFYVKCIDRLNRARKNVLNILTDKTLKIERRNKKIDFIKELPEVNKTVTIPEANMEKLKKEFKKGFAIFENIGFIVDMALLPPQEKD